MTKSEMSKILKNFNTEKPPPQKKIIKIIANKEQSKGPLTGPQG